MSYFQVQTCACLGIRDEGVTFPCTVKSQMFPYIYRSSSFIFARLKFVCYSKPKKLCTIEVILGEPCCIGHQNMWAYRLQNGKSWHCSRKCSCVVFGSAAAIKISVLSGSPWYFGHIGNSSMCIIFILLLLSKGGHT